MDTQPLSSQLDPNEPPTGAMRWFLAAVILAVIGIVALSIDQKVAAWCLGGKIPGDLRKVFGFSEAFGHGTGITLILITVFVLDPSCRRKFPRIVACLLTSALVVNLIKMVVARYRPKAFDEVTGFGQSIFDSFHSFFPLGNGGHAFQSFPSAHTAGAVALACCLSWVYPRGRWWFGILVVLVAMQRISAGAHFVSDTCFGAALGLVISAFFLKIGPISRSLTRFEQKAISPSPEKN